MSRENDAVLTVMDYVTGRVVPDIGAEANRQEVEKFLVEQKGYDKADLQVDAPIAVPVAGEVYRSHIDLLVFHEDRPVLVIRCVAGMLESYVRETVAAARVWPEKPIALAAVSDGRTAIVLDTENGQKIGEALTAIPGRDAAASWARKPLSSLPPEKLEKERLIFRSYDSMRVNVAQKR